MLLNMLKRELRRVQSKKIHLYFFHSVLLFAKTLSKKYRKKNYGWPGLVIKRE